MSQKPDEIVAVTAPGQVSSKDEPKVPGAENGAASAPFKKNGAAKFHLNSKVNILLVDDRQDKLLALEAVLGTLGENLVTARSGKADERRRAGRAPSAAGLVPAGCQPSHRRR